MCAAAGSRYWPVRPEGRSPLHTVPSLTRNVPLLVRAANHPFSRLVLSLLLSGATQLLEREAEGHPARAFQKTGSGSLHL